MKVTTGGMELLDTVTFLAIGLGETVVTLSEPDPLRCVLDFVEDTGKKTVMQTQSVDHNTLRMTLRNWNNSLGATLLQPLEVGVYGDRKLFALLHIAKAGKTGEKRLVTFSLYLGEKV